MVEEIQTESWPDDKDICEILICVSPKCNICLDASNERFWNTVDGIFTEDNYISNYPKEPGIYRCKIQFYFIPGYFEGHPAPGESDWGWKVIKTTKIFELPKLKENPTKGE
jgi:hypothetical protein